MFTLVPTDNGYSHFSFIRAPYLYDLVERYGYTIADLLGEYPIWDESKRDWLNNEIYEYFEYREIGAETAEMFASFIRRRMNRIMPRVNSIAAFALEGSEDWDVTAIENATSSGESSSATTNETTYGRTDTETRNLANSQQSTTETKATALQSDTPQTALTSSENYMTALSETGSSGTSSTSGTDTGTDTRVASGTDAIEGSNEASRTDTSERTLKAGQLSELANNWVNTMPDLLGLIFEQLENCFMQVY